MYRKMYIAFCMLEMMSKSISEEYEEEMAVELNVPVLVTAQLERCVDIRADHHPRLNLYNVYNVFINIYNRFRKSAG